MKHSATIGLMLLSMILAVSFGIGSAENMNMTNGLAMLINATSPETMTPMKPMSMMMTMPMNASMGMGMPENMASKSPTTLILQNVTFSIIVIGNLTEVTSTIIPQNAIDAAKNATLALK